MENQTLDSTIYGSLVHYYIAIELNVNASGFYGIFIWNSLSTRIKLYENSFHPFRSDLNSKLKTDMECEPIYNLINAELQANATYVLLIFMKTYSPEDIFPIKTYGPSTMTYNEISKHL